MIVEQAGGSTGTAEEAKKGDTTAASALKLSRLNLVDLAGSERAALMGESGDRLEESKKINLSLSALAKVMATLCEASGKAGGSTARPVPRLEADADAARLPRRQLPHRDDCVRVPLAAALEDTVTTLQFACRAKAIRNHAKINVQVSGDVVAKSVLTTQYEAQLNTLRTQLAAAEAAAKEATQALEAAPEAAEEKVPPRLAFDRRRTHPGGS